MTAVSSLPRRSAPRRSQSVSSTSVNRQAVSYFDSNPDGNGPEQQFQLGDPPVLSAFVDLARSPYFNPHGLR